MFTGIVEEMGKIKSIEWNTKGARLQIQASSILSDIALGHSISVNGCCLTVVDHDSHHWSCDVVKETMDRTNFIQLKSGDSVNLERSVKMQDRLGGHLVQGHVDAVGEIITKKAFEDSSWWVSIKIPPQLSRYIILKGSVAIDGVSLTVAEINDHSFSFAMIPHTAKLTTLGIKNEGSLVNIEVDMIAKYIERLIRTPHENQFC